MDDIKDTSAFIVFPGNGSFYEMPAPDVITAERFTISAHIESIKASLEDFANGRAPFVHRASNGIMTVVSPGPGMAFQILPGAVFREVVRQQKYAAMSANQPMPFPRRQ